jgi:asparagine synthase (glutamine-hydrolysing)
MRGFVALSRAPGRQTGRQDPDPRVLACLDAPGGIRTEIDKNGWVAVAADRTDEVVPPLTGAFTVPLGRMARTRQGDVSPATLGGMIERREDLAALLPPFAALHRGGPGEPLAVAGDWLGFHQLFWWQGDGVAAVSTSARALAALTGEGLDARGVGVLGLVGWQVGDTTPFRSVRALPPGTVATLRAGEVTLERYASDAAAPAPARPPALDDAVAEMADILRAWQTGYMEDHPETVIQLTGGHDSRILLAAVPDKLKEGMRALTLGEPSAPDVVIAARLAARYGMKHEVYRTDLQTDPTPERAWELTLQAARDLECQASPLALAPLLVAEGELEQGHRLGGLGGEVARGFYYAGQTGAASTSSELVHRLARWRLFSNEAVEADAVDPEFLQGARADTLALLEGYFPAGDWLRATDDFYLWHRMHRWAGSHGTVAAVRRHYVNPMFDQRFVQLALAVAPDDKRDSLLLGRLMTRLDPGLAAIPLDSGLTPARLAHRTFGTRLAAKSVIARKAVRKVRQRVAGGRRPQLGADGMSRLVLTHWRAHPDVVAGLRDLPQVRREWLDGVLSGERAAEPTTIAFLVNLLVASGKDHS